MACGLWVPGKEVTPPCMGQSKGQEEAMATVQNVMSHSLREGCVLWSFPRAN